MGSSMQMTLPDGQRKVTLEAARSSCRGSGLCAQRAGRKECRAARSRQARAQGAQLPSCGGAAKGRLRPCCLAAVGERVEEPLEVGGAHLLRVGLGGGLRVRVQVSTCCASFTLTLTLTLTRTLTLTLTLALAPTLTLTGRIVSHGARDT